MENYESGSVFGSYRIEGLIAGGGMGQVYAAMHEVYGRAVALKVLHPALHKDPSWTSRFNEEGLVGQKLKHPNILSARELVIHENRIALVMDLISGGQTLDKVLAREFGDGLPMVQALKVFLAVTEGVEYLHDREIIHGDLKPENVLIEGDYRDANSWVPRVTDFGTVTLIADPVMLDGRAAVVATPRYASPEHLLGIDRVEHRSDIYSLGLILSYLLTGSHLSGARNVEEAAKQVRKEVSLTALVDQPDSLVAIVRKACALKVEDRFDSCRALALEVRQLLDEVGATLDLDDIKADLATEIDEDRAAMKAESQAPKADPPQDSQSETEMVPMRSSDESGTTSGPAPASAGDTGAMVAPPETVDATGIRPNEVPGAVETPSQGVSNDAAAADALEDDGPAPWFIPVGIAVAMLVLLLVAIYAF